jgi:hypothetical protein
LFWGERGGGLADRHQIRYEMELQQSKAKKLVKVPVSWKTQRN